MRSWTLAEVAAELGVSKSSVSLWVRDVEFTPSPRNRGHRAMKPHPAHVARLADVERCAIEGAALVGRLSERELLLVGTALYVGEGFKRDGLVGLANTDPHVLRLFVTWLRRCFAIDEGRLRVRVYLHEGLEIDAAEQRWRDLLSIPLAQFRAPYRAVADATRRRSKHVDGCPAVTYSDSRLHRRVMGLTGALSSIAALPG